MSLQQQHKFIIKFNEIVFTIQSRIGFPLAHDWILTDIKLYNSEFMLVIKYQMNFMVYAVTP